MSHAEHVNQDWNARFATGEGKRRQPWLLWLLVLLVPITVGPGWLRIAGLAIVAAAIAVATWERDGQP